MLRSTRLLGLSLVLLPTLSVACDRTVKDPAGDGSGPPVVPEQLDQNWIGENTVALRHSLPVPIPGVQLSAETIVAQLQAYDPGSLIRCDVQDDPGYRAAVDTLGGVSWGYPVRFLEDESKPEFRLGPNVSYPAEGVNDSAGAGVEIEKADIVGLSPTAALFYSGRHGLLLVDLSEAVPKFKCAAKLPGAVRDFYYYQGHLVAMVGEHLMHFSVAGTNLQFVELVKLDGRVLDTRRFNDRLVVYSSLAKDTALDALPKAAEAFIEGWQPDAPPDPHRSLRVFKFGETLHEELHHSLMDTTQDDTYFHSGVVADDTAPGTLVHTGTFYGDVLWASDHYFVVTESDLKTTLTSWQTGSYNVCVEGHTVPRSYQSCSTSYETRPNPAYTPPDNSGGDRACKGTTLSDCLRSVARVSNPTIQVPVRTECHQATYDEWICDRSENQTYRYPTFSSEESTRLTIFEYTDAGFVRLDSKVHEITTPGLDELTLDDQVDVLTSSDEAFDLTLPGQVQTLYFQDGFLYAVSNNVLQVYAMGDSSLVRTSSLKVADSRLQSSLFSDNKLYLSDYGYRSISDHSTLRVVDLSNPAFPRQVSQDQQLPGGHASILATSQGILTVGTVSNFDGVPGVFLKLGLFADPFTTEKAYLILGTDLQYGALGVPEAQYFDRSNNRMFLPYTGQAPNDASLYRARVGVSQIQDDEIVSQGALHLPETIDRVRPRPGTTDQALAFGQSSIAWLTPAATEWNAASILSYYTPIALYRISDNDDYVEVLNLGSSCKLRFTQQATINQRTPESESEAFDCGGTWSAWAYGSSIVFGDTTGVRFDTDHVVTLLGVAEIAELRAKRQARPVCMYGEEPTAQELDFTKLPPIESLKCYTREEYQAVVDKAYAY